MPHELIITPGGHLALVEQSSAEEPAVELSTALVGAFDEGPARGLLHLATSELQAHLPPPLAHARSFASSYLARLCQVQGHEAARELPPTPAPRRGAGGVDLAGPADGRPGVPAPGNARRLVG